MKRIGFLSMNHDGYQVLNFSKSIKVHALISLASSIENEKISGFVDYKQLLKNLELEKHIEVPSLDLTIEDFQEIESLNLDFVFVIGWPKLISGELLSSSKTKFIGVHGSPWGITEGRGRSPQNWALHLGKKSFEVAAFLIDEKIDSGPVIAKKTFEISTFDNIFTLHFKTNYFYSKIIENIVSYGLKNLDQQDDGMAFYLPKRRPKDGQIDFNQTGEYITNLIRSVSAPYPEAYFYLKDHKINVKYGFKIDLKDNLKIFKNGQVISSLKDALIVKVHDGFLFMQLNNSENLPLIEHSVVLDSTSEKEKLKKLIDKHLFNYPHQAISPHIFELLNKIL